MSWTEQFQKILQALLERSTSFYGDRLISVVVFGSVGRGAMRPDSDVDVLVVLNGPVSPCSEVARTEHDVADVSLKHNCAVACFFLSQNKSSGKATVH